MALKAVHVSDVPNLDQVLEASSPPWVLSSTRVPKFLVIGHRGSGMNASQSSDPRTRATKENSIMSFNNAAKYPLDFVEFDVQVTTDGCPVIFHDDFIITEDKSGTVFEKRVTDLCLSEFLCYGPQRDPGKEGRPLLRKNNKDGQILRWDVENDDPLCTLQQVFEKVEPSSLGFNVEIKFDDHIVYQEDYLIRVLQAIFRVVFDYAKDRPIVFSTFQPDAALLVKKLLQDTYPVFFLTNCGGSEDVRRNSLEEARKLCLKGGLDGVVSEVEAVFEDPEAVTKIKESKLSLLTYGKLNNVPEVVYMQHLMRTDGVIVDFVQEITKAVSLF